VDDEPPSEAAGVFDAEGFELDDVLEPEDFDPERFEPEVFEAEGFDPEDVFDAEPLDPERLDPERLAPPVGVPTSLPADSAALGCVTVAAVLAVVSDVSSLPHPATMRTRTRAIVAVRRRCIAGTMASGVPAVARTRPSWSGRQMWYIATPARG
jgi:hypothetical protein